MLLLLSQIKKTGSVVFFLLLLCFFSCRKGNNDEVEPENNNDSLTLSDVYATDSTKFIFNYLIDTYGKKILSGQQDAVEQIKTVTGKYPAIGCFDLMEYSPSRRERGINPTGRTESNISWAEKCGGIISLCWHWNAPTELKDTPGNEWWRGFYTTATTFDIEEALADKNSTKYKLLIRDMDTIAYELKKYQAAGIPVLWRPLHEASGGWFWWGAKGPAPLKELWHIMYERHTNYHQLHNLIWIYTPGHSTANLSWYPGDSYVDIVGLDVYDQQFSFQWQDIQTKFNGKKLVTLSETGTYQDMDNLRSNGTWWSYFCLWDISKVTNGDIIKIYSDTSVVTADELFQ